MLGPPKSKRTKSKTNVLYNMHEHQEDSPRDLVMAALRTVGHPGSTQQCWGVQSLDSGDRVGLTHSLKKEGVKWGEREAFGHPVCRQCNTTCTVFKCLLSGVKMAS